MSHEFSQWQLWLMEKITLWLFNIAMENGPFIDDFPIKTSIYKGCSMAMLNDQMVDFEPLDLERPWLFNCLRWRWCSVLLGDFHRLHGRFQHESYFAQQVFIGIYVPVFWGNMFFLKSPPQMKLKLHILYIQCIYIYHICHISNLVTEPDILDSAPMNRWRFDE